MSLEVPPDIDPNVPHIARVYNYWVGGKDNFPVDRELAERFIAADPGVIEGVRSNRAFLVRAVEFLARECGIRQFLDIGTGIPTADNVHEVALRNAPGCGVLYVDNDPLSIIHGRALLAEHPAENVSYIDADLRDPGNLLLTASDYLDFGQPIGLMMLSVLHCIPDADDPAGVSGTLIEALPAGSYVAISHPASDIHADQIAAGSKILNKSLSSPVAFRPYEKVLSFFNDLELVEPGLVTHSRWRPHPGADTRLYSSWAGVARK
ncbi:MAG TPA: SAM-dependent methyltransferase [Streptosporangiaceae bacterium]|nr:SAM-dependent methyltransferase [Streptosporangiaceae bacterium]